MNVPNPENQKSPKMNVPNPENQKSPKMNVPNPENQKSPKMNVPNPESQKSPKMNVPNPENQKSPKMNVPNPENQKSPKMNVPQPRESKILKNERAFPGRIRNRPMRISQGSYLSMDIACCARIGVWFAVRVNRVDYGRGFRQRGFLAGIGLAVFRCVLWMGGRCR